MRKRCSDDKLHLDVNLDEAVERFARTKLAEMYANMRKAKKKKPLGGKTHQSAKGRLAKLKR
jgi:hypothetical protein